MQPLLVRQIISPLLERLLGRDTFHRLRQLEGLQFANPADLHAIQQRKLRKLLRVANRTCTYYANLFRDAGLNISADDPRAELARLPLLDKPTIRSRLEELTNTATARSPVRFNTGGSTGEPLTFFVDADRIAADKAARMISHKWFDAQPGDPEVYLWGSPIELNAQDHLKRWRDRLTNDLLLDAFNLSPESMRQYVDRINAVDPVSLFGYPSSLHALAEFCSRKDLPFTGQRLRAVFTSGEVLDVHQRQTLHEFFRVPIADGYGSRDGGLIAHECPAGCIHVFDPNIIVEILDDRGQPARAGQSGEIVITHLDAFATILIRYRTGDRAIAADGLCPCGRSLSRLERIEGRSTDHLVGNDGRLVHALAVIYVLREMSAVRQFQVRQSADRNVEVHVVPEPTFNETDRDSIQTGIKRRLGEETSVHVRVVERISASPSGKFRHVVSDCQPGADRVEHDWVCAT